MSRLAGALLLVPLLAGAEPAKLFDPPRVDDSPTAFACSAETLASGKPCVFEGKGGAPASVGDNRARARALAGPTCDAAIKEAPAADAKALTPSCVARLEAAAELCATEGAVLDPAGHFTSEGRACYRALADARTQAESLNNAAPTCCACLAEHHCGGAGPGCVAEAAHASLAASCGSDDCLASCAELVSAAPAKSNPTAHAKRAK